MNKNQLRQNNQSSRLSHRVLLICHFRHWIGSWYRMSYQGSYRWHQAEQTKKPLVKYTELWYRRI